MELSIFCNQIKKILKNLIKDYLIKEFMQWKKMYGIALTIIMKFKLQYNFGYIKNNPKLLRIQNSSYLNKNHLTK